jgi:hypothetical protein
MADDGNKMRVLKRDGSGYRWSVWSARESEVKSEEEGVSRVVGMQRG